MTPEVRGRLTILATFGVAVLLSIMPGPSWAQPFVPDWVALTLITVRLHPQLRMFPRWQQAVSVLVLLAINELIVVWIRVATTDAPGSALYWTPSVVGMLVWPWLFVVLRDIRRRAHLS